jgi:hypothetical protein
MRWHGNSPSHEEAFLLLRRLPDRDNARPGLTPSPQAYTASPAACTFFAAWLPAINLDQCTSIPPRLVLKLAYKLSPSHISNALGKVTILYHVLDG